MKIPKTAAAWMMIGSLTGFVVSPFASYYFFKKRNDILNDSPAYNGVKDMEETTHRYQNELAQCVPRDKNASTLEQCVELAKKYDLLQDKLTNLKNHSEYTETVEKAETMAQHSNKVILFSPFLLISYFIGRSAYRKREEEEKQSKGEQ